MYLKKIRHNPGLGMLPQIVEPNQYARTLKGGTPRSGMS